MTSLVHILHGDPHGGSPPTTLGKGHSRHDMENELQHVTTIYASIQKDVYSAYSMLGMHAIPPPSLADISQVIRLAGNVLIATRISPCNGALSLLEQAIGMRISMPHKANLVSSCASQASLNENTLNGWHTT